MEFTLCVALTIFLLLGEVVKGQAEADEDTSLKDRAKMGAGEGIN